MAKKKKKIKARLFPFSFLFLLSYPVLRCAIREGDTEYGRREASGFSRRTDMERFGSINEAADSVSQSQSPGHS